MAILDDLKKHTVHYYISMNGRRVCVKCYAVKCIEIYIKEKKIEESR